MRCNSASAGSSVSAPTAEVAAKTAAAAVAGRDRLASGVGAGAAYSAGAAVGVPSAKSADRCVKTIIRNVVIPRIDSANPNSKFKIDVRRALCFSPKPIHALVPYLLVSSRYMYEYSTVA